MASEVGGEQRCGTGARLRGGRENQGLSLAQAAERLHLDASTLEAMEAEDFAALGADVYVRGHLRRYAELIGESAAQLQELYSNTTSTAQPDLTRIARAEAPSDSSRRADHAHRVVQEQRVLQHEQVGIEDVRVDADLVAEALLDGLELRARGLVDV